MDTRPHPEDPLIGSCIDDRYRVTGLLGRGGMGVVYEGTHERLGRAVAIKVLGPDTATDPVVVERFLREARIASSLGHGNIVDVADLGRLEDGRPYLVMPRIDGVDLATLLQYEPAMPAARVVELLRGVAAALDLVHAKGLAHRDVKPENLMYVVQADGSETVLLTDFGIAGLIAVKSARLTRDGTVCGTPAYVAPELISAGEFDGRSDVYALATVAFEMMTGRLPFDDAHPTRVLAAKVEHLAPSLGAVAGRRFTKAVEDVIACGLARDPDERFQTTGAFIAALEQAAQRTTLEEDLVVEAPTLRDLGVREPRGLTVDAAGERARPRDFVRALKRVGAFAAIALLGWSAFHTLTRSAPGRRVQSPSVLVSNAAHVAPRPESQASPPPAAESLSVTDASSQQSAASVASQPAVREAGVQSARVPRPKPRANTPPAMAQASPAAAASIRQDQPAAAALNRAANQELLRGRLGSARELFERASEQDPGSVAAYRGLGVVNERMGRSANAAEAYRHALELEPLGLQADALRERLQRIEGAH